MNDYVYEEVDVEVVATTPNAVLVTDGSTDAEDEPVEHWVPRSLIENGHEAVSGQVVALRIADWKLEELGLV